MYKSRPSTIQQAYKIDIFYKQLIINTLYLFIQSTTSLIKDLSGTIYILTRCSSITSPPVQRRIRAANFSKIK